MRPPALTGQYANTAAAVNRFASLAVPRGEFCLARTGRAAVTLHAGIEKLLAGNLV